MDIWIFVRLSAKFTAWHRGVIKYSILGVKFDLILVLRSQFFELLRETLYKHALEHLEAAPPGKKWVIFFSSYSKCLSRFDLFEGL